MKLKDKAFCLIYYVLENIEYGIYNDKLAYPLVYDIERVFHTIGVMSVPLI